MIASFLINFNSILRIKGNWLILFQKYKISLINDSLLNHSFIKIFESETIEFFKIILIFLLVFCLFFFLFLLFFLLFPISLSIILLIDLTALKLCLNNHLLLLLLLFCFQTLKFSYYR